MLAHRWGRQAGQVRYRCVGHDEGGPVGCIETFLEAPIRSLAAQDSLQSGSYIISNRGMERMAMYNEEERRRRANARNQLVNLPVSQCASKLQAVWSSGSIMPRPSLPLNRLAPLRPD